MTTNGGGILARAQEALADRLRTTSRKDLGRAGRAEHVDDVLVDSISPDAREASLADVASGDGGELKAEKDPDLHPRFHSARSSCALAVNAFGPWRLDPAGLQVDGLGDLADLAFEKKLPIAGVGRRPPNLDAVCQGPTTLAIESKLLEHLGSPTPAAFADVYEAAVPRLAHPTWREEYKRLKEEPGRYRRFGGAQIVKHYLGVKSAFGGRPVRLLYLFWEPEDHEAHRVFEEHRADLHSFSAALADPDVEFSWMSYPDLWRSWDALSDPPWIREHLQHLRQRYELSLG